MENVRNWPSFCIHVRLKLFLCLLAYCKLLGEFQTISKREGGKRKLVGNKLLCLFYEDFGQPHQSHSGRGNGTGQNVSLKGTV
jgi:hypothetical protein